MAEMPTLIYGTAWKGDRTAALVAQAVTLGFRGIDTACQPRHYSEAGVGEALKALAARGVPRDALFLQTKFTSVDGQDPANIPYDPGAPLAEQVAQSFATTLRNLGTDRVDSWVLHSPLRGFADTMTVWRAMEEVHDAGGARLLGLSNCYDPGLFAKIHGAARVKPAVLQNRFYAQTGYDAELRAWCLERGVRYQSFWTLSANPELLSSRTVGALARGLGKTPPQILFRYLVQKGVTPLTGTTSEQRMEDGLAVASFELSAQDVAAVDGLLR